MVRRTGSTMAAALRPLPAQFYEWFGAMNAAQHLGRQPAVPRLAELGSAEGTLLLLNHTLAIATNSARGGALKSARLLQSEALLSHHRAISRSAVAVPA